MRRMIALLAGIFLLAGCTPNSLIELLYPKCKQEHTSCADASRNPDPIWATDSSHWSKPKIVSIGDTAVIPRDHDTTVVRYPER